MCGCGCVLCYPGNAAVGGRCRPTSRKGRQSEGLKVLGEGYDRLAQGKVKVESAEIVRSILERQCGDQRRTASATRGESKGAAYGHAGIERAIILCGARGEHTAAGLKGGNQIRHLHAAQVSE